MMALKTSHLVPKLRFPEFRAAPGWQLEEIGPFLQECSDRVAASTHLPVFTSSRLGLQPQEEYYGGNRVRNASEYGLVPPGYIVYRHMSDDGVFAFNINTTGNPIAVSKEYPVFRCVGIDTRFLHAMLNHSPAFLAFAIRQKAGGTRTRLYLSRLRTWMTHLPPPSEQQKIADCLGSLDDLIVAEGRKLEALRQHKQGLMQQLFPQPGETQPRLRFSEFQDGQEWCVAPLGKLFETTTGGTPDRARPDYWGGEVPWVTTSIVNFNVIESTKESISNAALSNSSAKVFPKRTVLMALYGQGKTRGRVAMLGVEAATNQACAAILPSDEVESRFVFLNLSGRYEEIRAISNSGGQKNLSQALVRDLPFAYPKERAEQHRIAECLTALDNQIAAQSRKLDTLKHHKQGLMQQLFPSLESQ